MNRKDKKSKSVFVVIAYRWGKRENHSYTVGCCSKKSKAIDIANEHTKYRGGKYACSVERVLMDDHSDDYDNYSEEVYKTKSSFCEY